MTTTQPHTPDELDALLQPIIRDIISMFQDDRFARIAENVADRRGISSNEDDPSDDSFDRYIAVEDELTARTLRLTIAELGLA